MTNPPTQLSYQPFSCSSYPNNLWFILVYLEHYLFSRLCVKQKHSSYIPFSITANVLLIVPLIINFLLQNQVGHHLTKWEKQINMPLKVYLPTSKHIHIIWLDILSFQLMMVLYRAWNRLVNNIPNWEYWTISPL